MRVDTLIQDARHEIRDTRYESKRDINLMRL